MPHYEYICKRCHRQFGEVLTVKEHETKRVQCPKCKCEHLEHVFEPFFAKTSSKTHGW